MAIQRKPEPFMPSLPPPDAALSPQDDLGAEVEIVDDAQILDDYQPEDDEEYGNLQGVAFDDNLAEHLPDEELTECAADLIADFDADMTARADWEKSYIDGLEYLGISSDERDAPWDGACGIFHPVLTEAVVRFQSQAILEIFPAAGPVRTQIVGKPNQDKSKQAIRIEEELNFILLEKMPEYRWETEQLLFRLPLAGSAFRKVYFDTIEERPTAIMVPAEDFVVPYGASNLKTAERFTHVIRQNANELKKLQKTGFYKDVELEEPEPEFSEINEAEDEISGQKPTLTHDKRHTLLEMHVDYDFGEAEWALPYVITIEKSSQTIISIRRNWLEEDPHQRKRIHFAHYQYMPGLGFYGIGLVHLIGGLAKGSTAILRQLVDSGTLANLLAGFKTRGLRVLGDDGPLQPGEFRDVEVTAGDIASNIYPLPFKEPSPTLYQLLNTLVDEGRRIASIADIDVGDMSSQAPVGTTLAILERSMKVMSAVHARLHAALRDELRLIANIVGTKMPAQYDYDEELQFNRQEDFSARVDILPVSDPNAATLSQRVVQYQSVFQMYQQNPELFDGPVFYRKMLEAMQVRDAEELVPLPDEIQPQDPITENMNLINSRPVKAFIHQDHESHIQVHLAAIMDPSIMEMIGQSPRASVIQGAAEAHIAEHIGFRYRQQIEEEMGVALPPPEEPLPPEVEVRLSRLVADAANRVFYRNKDKAQQEKNQQMLQDPLVQIQLREIKLKEDEFAHRKAIDLIKKSDDAKNRHSKEKIAGMTAGVNLAIAEDDRLAQEAQTAIQISTDFAKDEANKEHETKIAEIQAKAKPKPAAK